MYIPLFGCSVAELADLPVPKFLFQLKKKIEKSPGKVGHSTICRWRDSFSSALCSEHSGKMNAHAQLICRFSEAEVNFVRDRPEHRFTIFGLIKR